MRFFFVFLVQIFVFDAAFAATCSTGFNDVTANYGNETFYSKSNGLCPAGYEAYTAPSELDFHFGGLLLSDAPTLCGVDSHYEDGECVANTQETCGANFYRDSEHRTTFYSKNNGLCPSGYEPYTAPSNLDFHFGGMLLSSAPTLCASGHYVNGTCSSYSTNDCISNYVDMGVDDVVVAVDATGACPTGYVSTWQYQSCNAATTDNICTTLCNTGWLRTDAGYCASACSIGMTTMHVNNSTFRLYGTRTTQHSLVVGNSLGQCYVNMVPGHASGAIHVKYNNTVYHSTN